MSVWLRDGSQMIVSFLSEDLCHLRHLTNLDRGPSLQPGIAVVAEEEGEGQWVGLAWRPGKRLGKFQSGSKWVSS